MSDRGAALWHVISGERLLEMLRRAHSGEDPDLVYLEEYVNSEREQVDPPTPLICVTCGEPITLGTNIFATPGYGVEHEECGDERHKHDPR